MADYTTAATNLESSLETSGRTVSYTHGSTSQAFANPLDSIRAARMLRGFAQRDSEGSIFRVAKAQEATDE